VRDIKARAFKNPQKLLFPKIGKKYEQIKEIFTNIQNLKYGDEPDYNYIW
jgi:hypothetical protein